MAEDTLTHEQALMMLNDRIGKEVSVWLSMEGTGGPWVIVQPMLGVLGKTTLGTSDGGVAHEGVERAKQSIDPQYTVGGKVLQLPPLPGIVRPYEMGLEWVLAEGLTLRINWGGGA
jgi:hypothetical protein